MTAKELLTARIDGDLKRAAAAKAAEQGETVTDVLVRALTVYIQGVAPAPAQAVYTPPSAVHAPAGSPGSPPGRVPFREPPPCPHPKARVHKNFCGACGSHVG